VRDGDHREAASYFAQALRADPGNPLLISNAVFANAALGEWDIAAAIAEDLPPDANGQELAGLVTFVDTVRSRDLSRAREAIEAGRGGGPFVDELSMGWIEFGAGNMDRAVAVFEELTEDQACPNSRGCTSASRVLRSVISKPPMKSCRANAPAASARPNASFARAPKSSCSLGVGPTRSTCWTATRSAFPTPRFWRCRPGSAPARKGPTISSRPGRRASRRCSSPCRRPSGRTATGNLPLIYARAAYGVSEKNTDALILAGELLSSEEQYELAAETYGAVPADDDQFIEAQMGRAEALERQGAVDAALAVLRELAEAQPELAPIHAALGDTLRRAEMCEDAIDSYTAALDRVNTGQQRYWFLFYTRAICYHLTDNWPPAEADFRKALELNPEQPQVLNYLGYSLVEQRRNLDEALDMIERAVAARPDSGYIVDSWPGSTTGSAVSTRQWSRWNARRNFCRPIRSSTTISGTFTGWSAAARGAVPVGTRLEPRSRPTRTPSVSA
jgi:tetratricopeptide (TPR) repeat protein